jgi:hypothetical protein
MELTRDYSERQTAVFALVSHAVLALPSTGLDRVQDEDVADAAAALAGTLETASKGVIYEQRPSRLPAARVLDVLKPLVARAGEGGGSSFERDAAVVLRGIEQLARAHSRAPGAHGDGYLSFIRRMLGPKGESSEPSPATDTPRLILP